MPMFTVFSELGPRGYLILYALTFYNASNFPSDICKDDMIILNKVTWLIKFCKVLLKTNEW